MPSTFADKATDPQASTVGSEDPAQNQALQSDQSVALIVGERAFATMEDVKTKITNADTHIGNIEAENATLRAQLDEANEKVATSTSLEEVLKNKEEHKDAGLTEDQIKSLVNEGITSTNLQATEATNHQGCINAAQGAYGDNFIVKMQEIAGEIGLSMDEVDSMARGNPKLFSRTFIPTAQARVAPASLHTSTINTSNFQQAPTGLEVKPVLSLSSKERAAQYMRQLEAL